MSSADDRRLTDVQAEHGMLRDILLEPSILDEMHLIPDMFVEREHRMICASVLDLHRSGRHVSPHAVGIDTGAPDLQKLSEKLVSRGPQREPARMFHDRLVDMLVRRRQAAFGNAAYQAAHDMSTPALENLPKMESEMMAVRPDQTSQISEGWHTAEAVGNIEWRWENRGEVRGLRFGFPICEDHLDGLHPGRVYIVAARPGIGKTAYGLCMLAALCAAGRRVGVFSLEMDRAELNERLIQIVSGVPSIPQGTLAPAQLASLADAVSSIRSWRYWLADDRRMDMNDIEHKMRIMKRNGIEVCFVDYVQKIARMREHKSMQESVAHSSAKLHSLAGELGISMVILAQLRRLDNYYDSAKNRTVERRPNISDLKESGALEQDANAIGILFRDKKETPEHAEIDWQKNRGGVERAVDLVFEPSLTRFTEDPVQPAP